MSNQINFKKLFISKANELLMKREERCFELDEKNQFALDFFVSYFSNIEVFRKLGGKPYKGLFLYGKCGASKSLFFETLEEVYKKYPKPLIRIKTIHTIELTSNVLNELSRPNQLASNDISIYEKNATGSIHFEELGAERKLNHFGNSINVMSDIIQLRYATSRRAKCLTFITSNLSLNDIRKQYGERVYDRMFEMFNFIEIPGDTRRK
ncbi:hypothetical protein OEG92_14375 [Polaribacter sejongensis]|uniref:hypothetical protein n=1 Tax=Polaribacter sejongensis TaxID=985043 RepID=UPI0035A5DE01